MRTVDLGVTITDAAVDGVVTVVFCTLLDDGQRQCSGCGKDGARRPRGRSCRRAETVKRTGCVPLQSFQRRPTPITRWQRKSFWIPHLTYEQRNCAEVKRLEDLQYLFVKPGGTWEPVFPVVRLDGGRSASMDRCLDVLAGNCCGLPKCYYLALSEA